MCIFAATGCASYVFLAVLAVTVYVLLMRVQRHDTRPKRVISSLRPSTDDSSEHQYSQATPATTAQWEGPAHETGGELSPGLDNKMAVLERLIREADRASARLEAAAERAAGRAAEAHSSSKAETPPSDESPELPPVSQAEALRAAGAGDAKSHFGAHGDDVAASRLPADRRYEEIYTLADYGLEPAEIAHRVGSPVGEVELILSLRGKR